MSCLLRTRLHLAILIILSGFTLHFLRNWLLQGSAFDHRPLYLVFTGCEIAVMGIVSGLLWSRRPLAMRSLRILELTIFGRDVLASDFLSASRRTKSGLRIPP
jgi:hypothetical protein